jgi:adenine specific DNA methylase Mod
MRRWLKETVGRDDGNRHDKWLCMMWPRLVLLRKLLAKNGSLWMTLDDNEMPYARVMLDEIFGRENFVAQVGQKKYSSANDHTGIAPM